MEVFSWRSGPVGFGRTEDRPLQRSKTSSGGMSQSGPDYPGHGLCRSTYTKVRNAFLSVQRTTITRMTIEHDLCARSRARFLCSGHIHQSTPSLTLHRCSKAIRLSGSRWRQPGQTGFVALFERGEHQVRLVRVKQEVSLTSLAKTQLDPYQIEIKLTLCGLGWV